MPSNSKTDLTDLWYEIENMINRGEYYFEATLPILQDAKTLSIQHMNGHWRICINGGTIVTATLPAQIVAAKYIDALLCKFINLNQQLKAEFIEAEQTLRSVIVHRKEL